MSTRPPFAVGDFAASKPHLQLVLVLSRTGDTMTVTRVLNPDELPLPGTVTDADLLTLEEFEAAATEEPDLLDVVGPLLEAMRSAAVAAAGGTDTSGATAPQSAVTPDEEEAPRAIRITRTIFLHLVVTPEEEILHRVPVFVGDEFVVLDHQEEDGYDWMRVTGGRLLPLPPDAWEVVAA